MNHGGKREGAGRKAKADELKMIEAMDAILIPDEAWGLLAEKVKEKDTQAIKLWLAYRYGQPQAFTEISGIDTVEIIQPGKPDGN